MLGIVVGGEAGEICPLTPGPSPPMGARGGFFGWWWVCGGFPPHPRPLSPDGGEGGMLWLVVCLGEVWPFTPGPSPPMGARGGSL